MRDAVRTLESFKGLRSVKQIDRNVLVAAFGIRFSTGDGDHVPVVQTKKMAEKISAHDSCRAGNQRLLAVRHGRAPSVLDLSKAVLEVCLNGIRASLIGELSRRVRCGVGETRR